MLSSEEISSMDNSEFSPEDSLSHVGVRSLATLIDLIENYNRKSLKVSNKNADRINSMILSLYETDEPPELLKTGHNNVDKIRTALMNVIPKLYNAVMNKMTYSEFFGCTYIPSDAFNILGKTVLIMSVGENKLRKLDVGFTVNSLEYKVFITEPSIQMYKIDGRTAYPSLPWQIIKLKNTCIEAYNEYLEPYAISCEYIRKLNSYACIEFITYK